MKEMARVKILEYSKEMVRDSSEKLNEISELFDDYINDDHYSNMRNNPSYQSLVEFQYSMTVLFKSIGTINSLTVAELERKITGSLRAITSSAKSNPSQDVKAKKFIKLYNTLKIKYKNQLWQHGLEQEFEKVFFDLLRTLRDGIIRPQYKTTIRGKLLQDILDLLPENFYIDRNTFSKLIFGDPYYIQATYFHKDNFHTYPKTQTYNKIEKNILKIKTDSAYLYAGKPLSQTNLNDLKTEMIAELKILKDEYSSSKTTLPERVLKYYMEYIFGGSFEKDSAVDWITTIGQKEGELDSFNKEFMIAFEFNGRQHYFLSQWTNVYGLSNEIATKRFNRQNINDLIKIKECKEKGVALIVLSPMDHPNDWQEIIMHQYELWTGKKAPDKQMLSYDEVLRIISEEAIGTLKIKFLRNFD